MIWRRHEQSKLKTKRKRNLFGVGEFVFIEARKHTSTHSNCALSVFRPVFAKKSKTKHLTNSDHWTHAHTQREREIHTSVKNTPCIFVLYCSINKNKIMRRKQSRECFKMKNTLDERHQRTLCRNRFRVSLFRLGIIFNGEQFHNKSDSKKRRKFCR